MNHLKSTHAFDGPMYVGTNTLGRPLTSAESKELASFLRKHDFAGASLIALNFASKLARNKARAQDSLDRAYVRLIEQGWNSSEVTLAKCLCRFVWSEHTHARREDAARGKAEERFLREHGIDHSGGEAPSVEDYAVRLETEREEEARDAARLDALKGAFVEAGDQVNLMWLQYRLDGVDEPREMAKRSGLEPEDFYRAADRRNRHVERLLAAERGAKKNKEDN